VNLLRVGNLLLPLVLFSSAATGVTFMKPSFWMDARWLLLGLLAIYVLTAGRVLRSLATPVLLLGGAYLLWCIATLAWSDLPELTFAKLVALVLSSFAALLGGYDWTKRKSHQPGLGFLWPYAVLSLVAAAISSPGDFVAGTMPLYAGSTLNPNFLGLILATSTLVVIWQLYRFRKVPRLRTATALLLLVMLVVLYFTVSRSAYLIAAGIGTGFLLAIRARRALIILVSVGWSVLLLSALAPEATQSWVRRNIYKQADVERGLFYKREVVWSDSWDAAQVGGWVGAGFGVSVGSNPSDLSRLFTSMGYGREKGNSQLAMIEEIGVVGFVLYMLLVIVLFRRMMLGFKHAQGDQRVLLGLILGALFGMQVQSILEAWWISPGSTEYILFWALAGVGLGASSAARLLARSPLRDGSGAPLDRAVRV
jgi:hypothetical protein